MTHQATQTDIETIDRDHQRFHTLIDQIQAGVDGGLGAAGIARCQQRLLVFLDGHIAFENRLMREIGYPIAFTHIEEHAAFRDRVSTVLAEAGKTVSGANIAKLLKKIHDHHTKYFDSVLCYYLTDKYALEAVENGLGI
ncbi:MAG: hemerythrin family protein [Rhodospirillaceae bacterium]